MSRTAGSRKAPGANALPLPLGFDLVVPDRPFAVARARSTEREEKFFGASPTPASRTKTKIVVNTFLGWAGVMLSTDPVSLWYVDLFCGRGSYGDGTWSTPLELFDKVARDPRLRGVLKMLFNDRRSSSVFALRDAVMAHAQYGDMRFPPQFNPGIVDENMVAELRARRPPTPAFAFIDPFGYKGVTRELIDAILREYGCDVMFFFSYHAIKRVLKNPNGVLRGHLDALLGRDRVEHLRKIFSEGISEQDLEAAVLDALRASMRSIDGLDILTFAFRRRSGYASHHLAFVSKHPRGFEKAKEAMASGSSWVYEDDIPSLEYIEPGYENALVRVDEPSIAKLMKLLSQRVGGRVMNVSEAYASVLHGTPYVEKNVRLALLRFVQQRNAPVFVNGERSTLLGTSRFRRGSSVFVPSSL